MFQVGFLKNYITMCYWLLGSTEKETYSEQYHATPLKYIIHYYPECSLKPIPKTPNQIITIFMGALAFTCFTLMLFIILQKLSKRKHPSITGRISDL